MLAAIICSSENSRSQIMLRNFCFFIFFILITNVVFAFQINNNSVDTLNLVSRIEGRMRRFKQQNKLQIHRYYSPDSTITFGSNKQRSFLTSVLVIDKKSNENRWFYYESNSIFRISIVEHPRKIGKTKFKRGSCTYYFENNNLVFKKEEGISRKLADLLIEAENYQVHAILYLQGL